MNADTPSAHPGLLRKVLVALDGLSASEIAIDWVRLLLPDAGLVLGRVVEPSYVPVGDFGLAYVPNPVGGIEKALKKASSRIRPRPTVILKSGFPAASIQDIAKESSCDLIALVSRGGSQARRRFIGGTVERLLHEARQPLLVIPAPGRPAHRPFRLRKIVVPMDGKDHSERILPLLQPIARRHRAAVVLLHCWEGKTAGSLRLLKDRLRSLATGLRREGVRTQSMVVKGAFLRSLGRVIKAERIDLMAMSVYGHGALRHLLFGAKASRILQMSTVPVLVVRHDTPGVAV